MGNLIHSGTVMCDNVMQRLERVLAKWLRYLSEDVPDHNQSVLGLG